MLLLTAFRVRALSSAAPCAARASSVASSTQHHRPRQWVAIPRAAANPEEIPTAITLYGQPALHLALGALGGLIGTLIWKPLPIIQVLDTGNDAKPRLQRVCHFRFLAVRFTLVEFASESSWWSTRGLVQGHH